MIKEIKYIVLNESTATRTRFLVWANNQISTIK